MGDGRSPGDELLETEDRYKFPTFADIVGNREHLKHFHSYRGAAAAKSANGNDTINFHVDQGLFVAFTRLEHDRVPLCRPRGRVAFQDNLR